MREDDGTEFQDAFDSDRVDYWKNRTLGDVEPDELLRELSQRTEELLAQIGAFSDLINDAYEDVTKDVAVRAVDEIHQSADYVQKTNDLVRQYLEMRDRL